ncbi:MAG: hypothetical protein MJZ17_05035 [Bacteroidales bacterium]|nr:hypothetical protein [Bacteroidales bacterium]
MAVYHTVDGQPYSVTAGTDVTVTDADGLILGVSAGGQGSFVGNGGDVTITGDHHFVQIKGGGGGGNGGGGGGGEPFDGNLPNNDLRVGELGGDKKIYLNGLEIMQESTVIVDVVEANNANAVTSNAVFNSLQEKQDTLTAGANITIENNVISASGGEPFDGNLDADLHVGLQPKTKATGSVQILDSQAAGVLKIGDNPEISIPKWNGVQAYVDVTPAAEAYYYSDWRTQYMSITVPKVGSKPLTMFAWMKPSSSLEVRTPADLVDAINGKNSQGAWSGVRALAAELLPNGNIRLTNKRDNGAAGNVKLTVAATLFKEGTSVTLANGDDSPRTVDAVLSQLNAGAASCLDTSKTYYDEATGIVSLEALEYGVNDTISVVSGDLFANPTGMSGGFSGRKIYLNEQVLDIGGPPNIVIPETALPADNKLQNGHIYIVTANSVDGTNLSSLELPAFAKADIWLEYVSGSVSWSPNWSWVDDMVPEGLASGTRYFIEVFSDGVAEIAKLKYSYTHA